MRNVKTILMLSAVLMFAAAPAAADWDPGDGHKMHYPQLPDPFGWDVQASNPTVLADDWQCRQTGPVDDVHLWGSWQADYPPPLGEISSIHLSIHDNIQGPPSMPGDLLWERDFLVGEFTVRNYGTGNQGWLDPVSGDWILNDHMMFHQINIVDIPDPFIQTEGEIYWLDVSVSTTLGLPFWGWKTSQDHFMDDAVYRDTDGMWQELFDPITGESLDMAFVITPEPGTMCLLALGGIGVLMRRRRK